MMKVMRDFAEPLSVQDARDACTFCRSILESPVRCKEVNMEQIITLKVDLEYPEEAHHAIDEAVKVYEESKKRWDAFEINEAKSRARDILYNLCNEGYSMIWTVTDGAVGLTIWKSFKEPCVGQCYMPKESLFDIWVEKLVALCIATGQEVPKFITDKAGECW